MSYFTFFPIYCNYGIQTHSYWQLPYSHSNLRPVNFDSFNQYPFNFCRLFHFMPSIFAHLNFCTHAAVNLPFFIHGTLPLIRICTKQSCKTEAGNQRGVDFNGSTVSKQGRYIIELMPYYSRKYSHWSLKSHIM